MPKNKKRDVNTVVVRGKAAVTLTVLSGNSSAGLLLQPGLFLRLNNMQKGSEFYRFTRLRMTVPPFVMPGNSATGNAVLGYYPEETPTTITSLSYTAVSCLSASMPLAAQLILSGSPPLLLAVGHTGFPTLSVPKDVLLTSAVKMFRTNAVVSGEDADIVQGTILACLLSTATANVTIPIHVDYVVEFKGPVDSTLLTLTGQKDDPEAKQELLGFVDVPRPLGTSAATGFFGVGPVPSPAAPYPAAHPVFSGKVAERRPP